MEREKTYLITVTILEGRHYIWENMNSAVIVRVDNKRKCTAVKKNSDCPYYNEYFVFEVESTYEKLLEKNITIMVIQPKTCCRRRKILGTVKLDAATVINQKNSQFFHKWAVLASPKVDAASGPTGYLKVDIAVLTRGQTPKLPVNVTNDEIEGNLLTPMGFVSERQRAQFIFEIYKCENLQSKAMQFIDFGPNKTNNAAMDVRLSTFVEVTFAGISVRTTVRKNAQSPVFNERVTITDLFPPLCQRIKIEICFDGLKKTVHTTHFMNLKSISNDTVEGFLPTFGPSYIYMYSKQNLEGYAGSILLSIRTELLDNAATTSAGQKTNIQHGITALPEEQMFSVEETFLFATIFEANCISKKYQDKPICFRLTFGNITSETEIEGATGDGHPSNVTVAQKPLKSGKHFYFLNYAEEKPCLRIKSKWPDFRKRMYNSNMLEKISNSMKSRLSEIEQMFIKHNFSYASLIEEKLRDTIDIVLSSGRKYVEILSTIYSFDYGTVLDKERINMCLKTMNFILNRVEAMQDNKSKKFLFRKLEDIQKKLESLVEDAQACWPDIFLWITCVNKKVGYIRIPAREIIFSPILEERGENCGKIRPMLFLAKDKNLIICKIEVLLWLGLERQKQECFDALPSGFKYEGRLLMAEEKHLFEGKAYIFEGEVQPGFDASGLVDAFVQVAIGRELKETQVKKNVLVPLWDQTLTFYNICLYGSKEHIRNNHPTILIQLLDEDQFHTELVGRTIVKPTVNFLDDLASKIQQVNNPEKKNSFLKFHPIFKQDEILGELLAGFELFEISQSIKVPEEEQVISIPAQIKPNLVPYKIEVMFWGVRNLKKINLIRINRPRITFCCANRFINSDTIENAKKCPNFTSYIQYLKVVFSLSLDDSRRPDPKYNVSLFEMEWVPWTSGDTGRKGNRVGKGGNPTHIPRAETSFLDFTSPSQGMRGGTPARQAPSVKNMPSQTEYSESFIFKLFDSRKFGIYVFAGISISDTTPYLFTPMTVEERLNLLSGINVEPNSLTMSVASSELVLDDWDNALKQEEPKVYESRRKHCIKWFFNIIKRIFRTKSDEIKLKHGRSDYSLISTEVSEEVQEDFDWWTKFYASMEENIKNQTEVLPTQRNKLKIYGSELENQSDFKGFTDMLTSFEIFKGKRTGDETLDEEHTTAIFKGAVKIYRWPPEDGEIKNYVTPMGTPVYEGVLPTGPDNKPIQFVLRVYCVRALGLRPKDLSGKSDAYLELWLGDKIISDKENYVPQDTNPIFGRCFEFQASFPEYTSVTVKIFDHDMTSANDLIGETKIDIENRFYTKHRANCGIADSYYTSGYCQWRDQKKPTQILKALCKKWGVGVPEFKDNSICIGVKEVSPTDFKATNDSSYDHEVLALTALHRWHEMPIVGFKLVPEHVETRSLFVPDKPGIEQGKIQLWIDVFPREQYPVPEKVNITPRKPVSYELRVVIWNVEEVVLKEDDFFTGEKKSDIYVKGWLDDAMNPQYTDVHYRSLTGEGNFNWRFIFPFDYLSTENKLIMRKNHFTLFGDDCETKMPCVLNLTVWDNDTFAKDDFLGSLTLELARVPRGARSPKKCDLSISDPTAKKISLFKVRRTKGWWPFKALERGAKNDMMTGKLEAELEILTKEEAERSPAGLGRQGPQSLPPPKTGERQHHSNHQHGFRFDEEIPKFFCHPKCPLRNSKCIYCRGDRARDCKIFLAVLIFVLLIFCVTMGFYFGGYIKGTATSNCIKKKRGTLLKAVDIEDDLI